MDNIREYLQTQHNAWRSMGMINPLELVVLEKGKVYHSQKFKGYGRRQRAKQCFRNALLLAHRYPELRYVEGFAVRPSIGLLMQHAWCIDSKDRVVDPTWKDPEDSFYIGVELDRKWAWDKVIDKGYYGVLCGDLIDLKAIGELWPEYKGREWRCEQSPEFKKLQSIEFAR